MLELMEDLQGKEEFLDSIWESYFESWLYGKHQGYIGEEKADCLHSTYKMGKANITQLPQIHGKLELRQVGEVEVHSALTAYKRKAGLSLKGAFANDRTHQWLSPFRVGSSGPDTRKQAIRLVWNWDVGSGLSIREVLSEVVIVF